MKKTMLEFRHPELHAALEAIGGVAAIGLALLMRHTYRRGGAPGHEIWLAASLAAMGVLDLGHAIAPPQGPLFLWLHALATALGGLLAALAGWPGARLGRLAWRLPEAAGVLALVVLAGAIAAEPRASATGAGLPAVLSAVGGALFVGACAHFLRRGGNGDSRFGLFCAIFGASAVVFAASRVWDPGWWLWHAARLAGYVLVLRYVLEAYRAAQKYRSLFDSAMDGVVLADAEGRLLEANPAALELLGYSLEELRGLRMSDIHPGKSFPVVLETGPGRFLDVPTVTRDGRRVPMDVHASVLDYGGRRVAMGIFRDASARQAAREAEQRFTQLVESIREAFWIADAHGTLQYVSPAFARIWGVAPESPAHAAALWEQSVEPEDRSRVREARERQRRGEAAALEYRIRRPDGSLRWIRSRAFPVLGEGSRLERITGLAEDITERRLAEEARLEEALRQRDALVREVHHRIKNNLQGVVGLLAATAREREELSPIVAPVIAQVRTVAVVHGLHGQAVGGARLGDMVEAIARSIESLTQATIALRLDSPASGTVVSEHESVAVALILNELLFNAVKHAARPQATVSLAPSADGAIVRIRNPGTLPQGFSIEASRLASSGLGLVRALQPAKGFAIRITQMDVNVFTEIRLSSPVTVAPPHAAARA